MKTSKKSLIDSTYYLTDIEEKRLAQFVALTAVVVTLAISPFSSYDPINPVKTLIMITGAGLTLGLLLSTKNRFIGSMSVMEKIAFTALFLALVNPLIFAPANLGQQIYGIFGRNNGFVCYVGLCVLALGSTLLRNASRQRFVLMSLTFTSIPEVVYALIQIFGNDPIAWSSFAPFGTLGNVNFISAFLGLAFVSTFGIITNKNLQLKFRLFFLLQLVAITIVLTKCGSSQGYFVVLAGLGSFFLYFVITNYRNKVYSLVSVLGALILLVEGVRAFFNEGILAKYVYQPTITFRFDYIHAGFEMLKNHPLTGVGLDSYDDYYRSDRGLISTLRTGPNRVANTAHNILMDFGANGGYLLLIAWIAFQVLALFCLVRYLRRNLKFDWQVGTLISVWIGYLLQSLISINQVGVAVWGWVITGCIIGLSRQTSAESEGIRVKVGKFRQKEGTKLRSAGKTLLKPSAAALSFFIGVLSFCLAAPPYLTDKAFKNYMFKSDLPKMAASAAGVGGNAWLLSQAIQGLGRDKDIARAKEYAELMSKRYPRNYYSWQVINSLENATVPERNAAYERLKVLDPYNPCFSPDAVAIVKTWLQSLDQSKQNEVVSFWNLPSLGNVSPLKLEKPWQSLVPLPELEARIYRFCHDG